MILLRPKQSDYIVSFPYNPCDKKQNKNKRNVECVWVLKQIRILGVAISYSFFVKQFFTK